MPGYTASKHAILGITRVGAHYNGKYGIRVNSISPGHTKTETYLRNKATLDFEQGEAVEAKFIETTPMKRLCFPEEQANVVSFLLSPESSYINGENIAVDGGFLTSRTTT